MFGVADGSREKPLPYALLLSSFEFRLAVATVEPALVVVLLPLCNAMVEPVVLLFREERSRCFVATAAVIETSEIV